MMLSQSSSRFLRTARHNRCSIRVAQSTDTNHCSIFGTKVRKGGGMKIKTRVKSGAGPRIDPEG
jgi:hypothetical protein